MTIPKGIKSPDGPPGATTKGHQQKHSGPFKTGGSPGKMSDVGVPTMDKMNQAKKQQKVK